MEQAKNDKQTKEHLATIKKLEELVKTLRKDLAANAKFIADLEQKLKKSQAGLKKLES